MSLVVTAVYRYPVKSLAAAPCDALTVDEWGPSGDRRWLVVDDHGRFVTQRQLPKMCRIYAQVQGRQLLLRDLDDGASIVIEQPEANGSLTTATVWRDQVESRDAGDEVAQWLSDRLGRRLRLFHLPAQVHRQVDLDYAPAGVRVSYADGFPFLICHGASLRFLQQELGRPLDMQRFRPNIVIDGAEAFAEGGWRSLAINGVEFDLVKPCSRCAIPTIALESGEKEADVFPLLRKFCQTDSGVIFGQNAIHRGSGVIGVGDVVELLA
ncbi:MOSC domain-containing protein [Spongiibacter sp. KMU-166]|uniref:MOSC domain-containing protein n=1 Tax=Spongiibacter thalassae TaxID=2721624 RepID=A0ABX1GDE3_9GAMM|nr:MOSC N-terminal beta barrel domain-containing protein [Spongiibacter thalassae]NKI17204.1 MOSC domain-containing protein [Spongiibacter thalassae]